MQRRPYAFSRALLAPDETFLSADGLAERIHDLREDHTISLKACSLADRGGRRRCGPVVEVQALDEDGNVLALLGYAFLDGSAGNAAVGRLQGALDYALRRPLIADPDAGRDPAVL